VDKLPRKAQPQAKGQLTDIVYAESRPAVEKKRDDFLGWWPERRLPLGRGDGHPRLGPDGELLPVPAGTLATEGDQHRRIAVAALRLRTNAAKRFTKVENATAVI